MPTTHSPPCLIEIRFPHVLVAGYHSVMQMRLRPAWETVLTDISVEWQCEGFRKGCGEWCLQLLPDGTVVKDIRVLPESAGHHLLTLNVRLKADQNLMFGSGLWRPSGGEALLISNPPPSLEQLQIIVSDMAVMYKGLDLSAVSTLNDLLRQELDTGFIRTQLQWNGFQPPRTLRAGLEVFGRYRLIEEIRGGNMAVLWKARDEKWKTRDENRKHEVVLKFLPEAVAFDEASLANLQEEVIANYRLTHLNILRIHYLATDNDGLAAIVMELIRGSNFSALRLKEPGGVFQPDTLLPLLRQVCGALDFAHRNDVVHHDIKPANLMLEEARPASPMLEKAGCVKVCDFGLSGSLCENASRLSMTSRQRLSGGTLCYMSPQHLLRGRRLPLDDIYSLAATVYELLTGKPPFFSGDIASQVERIPPPSIADRRKVLGVSVQPPVPAHWESTLAAALSKDDAPRPQTAMEFLHGLETPEESVPEPEPVSISVLEPVPVKPPPEDEILKTFNYFRGRDDFRQNPAGWEEELNRMCASPAALTAAVTENRRRLLEGVAAVDVSGFDGALLTNLAGALGRDTPQDVHCALDALAWREILNRTDWPEEELQRWLAQAESWKSSWPRRLELFLSVDFRSPAAAGPLFLVWMCLHTGLQPIPAELILLAMVAMEHNEALMPPGAAILKSLGPEDRKPWLAVIARTPEHRDRLADQLAAGLGDRKFVGEWTAAHPEWMGCMLHRRMWDTETFIRGVRNIADGGAAGASLVFQSCADAAFLPEVVRILKSRLPDPLFVNDWALTDSGLLGRMAAGSVNSMAVIGLLRDRKPEQKNGFVRGFLQTRDGAGGSGLSTEEIFALLPLAGDADSRMLVHRADQKSDSELMEIIESSHIRRGIEIYRFKYPRWWVTGFLHNLRSAPMAAVREWAVHGKSLAAALGDLNGDGIFRRAVLEKTMRLLILRGNRTAAAQLMQPLLAAGGTAQEDIIAGLEHHAADPLIADTIRELLTCNHRSLFLELHHASRLRHVISLTENPDSIPLETPSVRDKIPAVSPEGHSKGPFVPPPQERKPFWGPAGFSAGDRSSFGKSGMPDAVIGKKRSGEKINLSGISPESGPPPGGAESIKLPPLNPEADPPDAVDSKSRPVDGTGTPTTEQIPPPKHASGRIKPPEPVTRPPDNPASDPDRTCRLWIKYGSAGLLVMIAILSLWWWNLFHRPHEENPLPPQLPAIGKVNPPEAPSPAALPKAAPAEDLSPVLNPEWIQTIGNLIQARQFKQANEELKQFEKEEPELATNYRLRATLTQKQNEWAAAEPQISEVSRKFQENLAKGNWEEALQAPRLLRAWEEQFPKSADPGAAENQLAQAMRKKFDAEIQAGNPDGAENMKGQLLDLQTRLPEERRSLIDTAALEKALADCRKKITAAPPKEAPRGKTPEARLKEIDKLLAQGLFDEAGKDLQDLGQSFAAPPAGGDDPLKALRADHELRLQQKQNRLRAADEAAVAINSIPSFKQREGRQLDGLLGPAKDAIKNYTQLPPKSASDDKTFEVLNWALEIRRCLFMGDYAAALKELGKRDQKAQNTQKTGSNQSPKEPFGRLLASGRTWEGLNGDTARAVTEGVGIALAEQGSVWATLPELFEPVKGEIPEKNRTAILKRIQAALNQRKNGLGAPETQSGSPLFPITEDGKPSAGTTNAILHWERNVGLPPTGRVTPSLLQKLAILLPSPSASPPPPAEPSRTGSSKKS